MLNDQLHALKDRTTQLGTRRRTGVSMYAAGLEDRLLQMEFCLEELGKLESVAFDTSSSAASVLTSEQKAQFFCDTFWTWVYSSLDILAQIINQTENLGLKEDKVSFETVFTALSQQQPGSPLLTAVTKLSRSRVRSWMKAYRNCTNHRRPICLFQETHIETVTATYQTATGPVTRVQRHISDHSVALTPNPKTKIELLPRCEDARRMLYERLETIVTALLPN